MKNEDIKNLTNIGKLQSAFETLNKLEVTPLLPHNDIGVLVYLTEKLLKQLLIHVKPDEPTPLEPSYNDIAE